MNTKQRIALITKLIEACDKLNTEWDKATAVFGTRDNPLFEATWKMFDLYVSATSQLIGDESAWLSWFIYENACGKKEFEATAGTGAKKKKIKTIADLVSLIEWRPKGKAT